MTLDGRIDVCFEQIIAQSGRRTFLVVVNQLTVGIAMLMEHKEVDILTLHLTENLVFHGILHTEVPMLEGQSVTEGQREVLPIGFLLIHIHHQTIVVVRSAIVGHHLVHLVVLQLILGIGSLGEECRYALVFVTAHTLRVFDAGRVEGRLQ